ncbi:Gldg family protein [Myxococcota bacterium]|nr:Gldg family protein [Myxococcota bacterium]
MSSGIMTTARKELRSYFLSPVAVIFLGVFLVVTLFSFFYYAKFFARNIADVRPLFQALPFLLIFLVSAITMRQWSEEQKMGTMEILLTLPVRTRDLVLGKFLAGMALVGLALALTLPLPITVANLGQLDWGPVVGGYVAAAMLASAYMAIGLCVSARTDNQIVALMVTAVICAVLYGLGSDTVTGFFGTNGAEVLRALGSGSRFASIERGVLDVRDLFYYGSLTAFFLLLNGHFIERQRIDVLAAPGQAKARALGLLVGLAAANVVVGNLWLAPVTALRADLTAGGEYSISPVTEEILENLAEPLTIAGYFSEKTHPLLAPLVPRLRDFLTEYEIRGRGKVTVEFTDPSRDKDLEEELNQSYSIKTFPFRITGSHEDSVVNSYFHVLIKYGDEFQVLSFDELIEVNADETNIDVRLRNIEYDITRAIKKTTQGFQNLESVFARATQPSKLVAYISADKLPAEFKEAPERIRKVAKEIQDKSNGKFTFQEIDPSQDQAVAQEILQKYGFKPMATDLFAKDTFYLHILFQSGETLERVFPQGDMGEADIRTAIEASIKRATPGFLKTVGLLTEEPKQEQPNPMMGMQPPPRERPDYRALEETFGQDLTIKRVDLKNGVVPQDIDVLVVAKPGKLDEKQQFAVDQYLMRGGAVVALTGAYGVKIDREGISTVKQDDSILGLLSHYGVTVEDGFVMDPVNARFPMPVQERRGMFVMQRIEMMPYPFFPDIRGDGFKEGHVALAGLPGAVLTWSSPLKLRDGLAGGSGDLKAEVLIESSEKSWVRKDSNIEPRPGEPDLGYAHKDEPTGKQAMAVTLVGRIPSYFADKPSPLFAGDAAGEGADRTGRTLKESVPDARLVVVGSSEFASDLVASLAQQMGGGPYRGNLVLARNLVDWTMEDTDLLQIRSGGAFSRTLRSLEPKDKTMWEVGNYLVTLALLGAIVASFSTRRWRAVAIQLTPEVRS